MNDEMNPLESERLRRLFDAVAELPREVAPPEDGWKAIRRRIDAGRVRTIAPGESVAMPNRRLRWWALAAAASILVAVAMPFVLRSRGKGATLPGPDEGPGAIASVPLPAPPDAPPDPTPAATIRAVTTIPTALAASNSVLASALDQYRQAARELEAEVAPRTAGLPPQTREVVRRSLATIDSAIADLYAALGQDPANTAAGQSLGAIYERKLDFLKRVRAMPGAGM